MRRSHAAVSLVSAGLMLTSAGASALPITITGGSLTVAAYAAPFGMASSTITPAFGLSLADSVTAGPPIPLPAFPEATSGTSYSLTNAPNQTLFDIFAMNHAYAFGEIASSRGRIDFTTATAVAYEITGSYSGTGSDADDAYSRKTTLGAYAEADVSVGTSASFSANDTAEGNSSPWHWGSRTGTIGPGNYTFLYDSFIADVDGDGSGTSSANGFARLTLTAVPVPEPASIALLVFGLLGTGAWRRRT